MENAGSPYFIPCGPHYWKCLKEELPVLFLLTILGLVVIMCRHSGTATEKMCNSRKREENKVSWLKDHKYIFYIKNLPVVF